MSYRSVKDDSRLEEMLLKLSVDHPREGFWKCYDRIRNSGERINHKRLYRVYRKLGLSLRRKCKKRLPARTKEALDVPQQFTHTWSIDFMSDALEGGRKFRTFNVIDDYNREVLFVEADYSLKSNRVIWVLRHLISRFGRPARIRMDNGPELVARLVAEWGRANEIEFKYIQPGKPMQNGYIERFNKSYREGVLDAYVFRNLDEVREQTASWIHDYNHFRPHDALGGIPPIAYRNRSLARVFELGPSSTPASPTLHSGPAQKNNLSIDSNVYF
jgi:putative transposase